MAEVEIWRFRPSTASIWTWNHDADTHTDNDGRFTFRFTYDIESVVYALRVKASNYAAVVWPDDVAHTVPFFARPGEPGDELKQTATAPGQVLRFDFLFRDQWIAKHFNLADTVRAGFDFIAARRDPRETEPLPRVAVQPTSITISWFNALADTVVVNNSDAFKDAVVLHEYGHYIEEQISSLPWILSAHDGCIARDNVSKAIINSRELAWMEAFSDWFAQAVRRTFPGIGLADGGATSSESTLELGGLRCAPPGGPNAGDTVEDRVAGVLWDLFDDDTTEFRDTVSKRDTEIVQILDREQDVPPHAGPWPDIQTFRNAWAARGLPMGELDSVFALNGIIPSNSPAPGQSKFLISVDFSHVDDVAILFVNGMEVCRWDRGGREDREDPMPVGLSPFLTGRDDEIRIRLGNSQCWATSLTMTISINGLESATRSYSQGYGVNCGLTKLDWRYRVNKSTGQISRLDCFDDRRDENAC